MKRLVILPLLAFQITTTTAWTFTWRNASSSSFLKNSHDPAPCTNIEQAKGQEFDFHPENDDYNFYIWATENCTGSYAGYTTPDVWRKRASKDMRSYLVDYGDGEGPMSTVIATATSSASSTSSAPSTSPTAEETSTSAGGTAASSATATASASASASSSPDSGTSVSGGAIAGIVIAVVAGLSILGAGFFYLGRRARRGNNAPNTNSPPSQPTQDMYAPPGSSHGAYPGGNNTFAAQTPTQYPPHGPTQQLYYGDATSPLAHSHSHTQHSETSKMGTQKAWVELPGEDMVAVELSGSRQVNELEGHSKMRYQ